MKGTETSKKGRVSEKPDFEEGKLWDKRDVAYL